MPKNNEAWIYLLEDINDNRYIGSTGEKRLEDRLATHKRDEKSYYFNKRKGKGCSSMKLNLYNSVIIPLMKCENKWEVRKFHESHYINNVYPECVNQYRLKLDGKTWYEGNKEKMKIHSKKNYEKDKEKFIKRATEWRNNNKDRVNAKRREYYQKNKERLRQQKKEYYIRSKLKKKNINNSNNEDP